jgi:hypothetical protein
MKGFFVLAFIAAARCSTISDSEACSFVGFRFAHTRSTCDEAGLCSNVAVDGTTVVCALHPLAREPLTCDAARRIMEAFLAPFAQTSKKRPRSEESDSSKFLTAMRISIIPELDKLSAGRSVDRDRLYAAMRHLGEQAVQMAAINWSKWRNETCREITADRTFGRLKEITKGLVWYFLRRLLDEADWPGQEAIGFLFDISALVGETFFLGSVTSATWGFHWWVPKFRQPDNGYAAQPSVEPIGFPKNARGAIQSSSMLERFSSGAIYQEDFASMESFLKGWLDSRRSESMETMIQDQVRRDLCPVLYSAFVEDSRVKWKSITAFKIATSLISVCRMFTKPRDLELLVDAMGRVYGAPMLASIVSPAFLADPNNSCEAGFHARTSTEERKDLISEMIDYFNSTLQFIETDDSGRRVPVLPDQPTGLSFGRTIGLAVRERVDLRVLRLSPDFVYMLHPKFRSATSNEYDREIFFPQHDQDVAIDWEPMHTFLRGFLEGMGPGGVYRFDIDEIVADRFGAPLIYA